MLTKLIIRNFKRLRDVEIELGQTVVLVGANNSGKTTALQALSLWYAGIEERIELVNDQIDRTRAYGPSMSEYDRPIARLSLAAIPVPRIDLLWHNLKWKNGDPVDIQIRVEGIDEGNRWYHDLTFRYGNEESLYCEKDDTDDQMFDYYPPKIAFLTPISGIASVEPRLELGRINVLIGEGRTAEVLRNLCYQVYEQRADNRNWESLIEHMRRQFAIEILPPDYLPARGEIRMAYRERNGFVLDVSSAGRGMLQTLLLLAYMYANPGSVLLLDEPDAHLEILRQREIYQLITTTAREQKSQIIMATHSEVILNEAGEQDILYAFVGTPHRIDDRTQLKQFEKALKLIGFDQYYQAEQTGWVLYLEGSTDLAVLQAFARILNHGVRDFLNAPFVDYVANDVSLARDRFYGLRAAYPQLVGFALYDRLGRAIKGDSPFTELMWRRREIENYICQPETLIAYAQDTLNQGALMERLIIDNVPPAALRDSSHPFWTETKASDGFLDPLFERFFAELELPNLMRKTNYHRLADYVPKDKIDPEVIEKLDAIVEVARKAKPRED